MNKKRIAVVGHVDHGPTALTQAIKDVLEKTGKEVIVVEDGKAEAKSLEEIFAEQNSMPITTNYIHKKAFDAYNETFEEHNRKLRLETYHPVRTEPKIYPNQPCPCGSGKKYKKRCR